MTSLADVELDRLLDRPPDRSVGTSARPAEAVLWNGLGVGGRHAVQFAATMVLARVLTPEYFGAVGMVVVVAAFATTFADLGLGVALVQHRSLVSRHLDAAFCLTITAGALLTAALWVAAPAVATFYDEPVLTPVTRAIAFQFVFNGVGIVPRALLVRAVQFRTLALIELSAGSAAAGAAIVLALRGAGVWALVGQILIAIGVSAVLCAAFAGWRPRSIAGPRHLSDVASFSRNLVAFRAVNYWSRNADNLLVGRFLGPAPLGLYGLAYQLILLPLQQVTSTIGEVMVPVMARGRADPAQVRLAFTRAVQAVALVLFPIMIGIVIVADEAIPILFGDQWRAAAPVARVLAVGGCFQALGATVGWIYQSQGRSDVMFRWSLFATVITVAGIVAGLSWGVLGVATGYTAAVVVLTPLSHHVAGRLIGMRMREMLLGVKPALVATIVMAVTASVVRTALVWTGQGDLVVFLGTAIAGISVYALALAALRPVSFDVLGSLFTRSKHSPLMRPRSVVQALRRVATIARAKTGRWKVYCPVCRSRFRAFLPAGIAGRPNASCPSCGALERHRLQWLFLRDRSDLFHHPNRVLHIAPEPCLMRHLAGNPLVQYVTADRDRASGEVSVDVTELAFADDSFDVILCSHVLEHIPDDAAAMAEFLRVLKPDGWAILQVPLDEAREDTFEDASVIDPVERERLFGQADHVRVYGRDYGARLEHAGFRVHIDDFAYGLDEQMVAKYALLPESIYVCRKESRR